MVWMGAALSFSLFFIMYITLLDFFFPLSLFSFFNSTDMNVNTDAYVLDSYIIRDLPFHYRHHASLKVRDWEC